MTLRFNDGVEFETTGRPRIESRFDGLYVVGGGSLTPVNSREEANEVLKEELQDFVRKKANRNNGGR